MGSLELYMRDMYPNWGVQETSTEVVPETGDQDALGEDIKKAESIDARTPSSKNIFIGIAVIVCVIVFFGSK